MTDCFSPRPTVHWTVVFSLLAFVKIIKAEVLWQRSRPTRHDAEMAIFDYINGFFNPRRSHSALGRKSPLAFERKVA